MCTNNQNPSETRPLLEEHVEIGQVPLRSSRYRYYIMAVVLCTVVLGAGLIIYYAEGKLDNAMYLIKRKRSLK